MKLFFLIWGVLNITNLAYSSGQGISGGNPQFSYQENFILMMDLKLKFTPDKQFQVLWNNGKKYYSDFGGNVKIQITENSHSQCQNIVCVESITQKFVIGYKKIDGKIYEIKITTLKVRTSIELIDLFHTIAADLNNI